MNKSISYKLAEFAHSLKLKDVPKEVVDKAKLHVLDTLGIMMFAYTLDAVNPIVKVCKLLGGPQESTVIGHGFKVAAPNAAMANSTMAHSLDYDDTHLGSVHQSCIAVPTSFAVGEKVNSSGKNVLEAIIIAYETNARLGLVSPRSFHPRGFHPTSVLGVFGSALSAGKLIGLTAEQLGWSLGIAGSLSSGIGQPVKEGIPLKAMHPAFAVHSGIIASLLAAEGCKGPLKVFEGEAGFFNAYLWGETVDISQATIGLGEKWETLHTSLKPYPSCHATHSAIEVTLALKNKHNIKFEEVQECTYYLSKYGMELTKSEPSTAYGAKFSIRYCVAVALKKGRVGVDDFADEAFRDKEILKFMQKIKIMHDKAYDSDEYVRKMVFPARAKVRVKNGNVYEEEIIDHKGTPNNPLTQNEVVAKFLDNIKLSKFENVGGTIIDKILNIEKHDINEIMQLLD